MAKKRKKKAGILRWVVLGVFLLLVIAITGLTLYLNIAGYKRNIEAAASDTLGMEVRIHGRLGIGFVPNVHLSLHNVVVRDHGPDLAAIDETDIGIRLLSLFDKQLRIGKISLKRARIQIERAENGTYNFDDISPTAKKNNQLDAFEMSNLALSDLSLIYIDKSSNTKTELELCDVTANDIRLGAGKSSTLLDRLSFDAQFSCRRLRAGKITASELKLRLKAMNGTFDFNPVTLRIFGGQGHGNVHMGFADNVRQLDVHYDVAALQLNELLKTTWPGRTGGGNMDFALRLTARGKGTSGLRRNMNGTASLRGQNLTINGTDLDRQIARYESSQSFDLLDAGAFFFVGPLGLVATKGQDFVSVLQNAGGSTHVSKMVSDWAVRNGVAQSQDVAMATHKNRIAMTGRLNFVYDRFDGMTVALIDTRGCATALQTIHGSFSNPVIDKPDALKAITGPVVRLLKGLTGGNRRCKIFYAGSLPAP